MSQHHRSVDKSATDGQQSGLTDEQIEAIAAETQAKFSAESVSDAADYDHTLMRAAIAADRAIRAPGMTHTHGEGSPPPHQVPEATAAEAAAVEAASAAIRDRMMLLARQAECPECLEQARLVGMGGERELALMAQVERLERALAVQQAGPTYDRSMVARIATQMGWTPPAAVRAATQVTQGEQP